MTIERVMLEMTNDVMTIAARKAGYTPQGKVTCEACAEEATVNGTIERPYTNIVCALKFHKKGSTKLACACGWRKDITIKFNKIEKPKCSSCGATLNKDGYCYNPNCTLTAYVAPTQGVPTTPTTPTTPTKVCSRPGCNNPVPAGRKTICDSCRNTPKEPVSSGITM